MRFKLNQAAKQYIKNGRRDEDLNELYKLFNENYSIYYIFNPEDFDIVDEHDVRSCYDDSFMDAIWNYDGERDFTNLLNTIIKNNRRTLLTKRTRQLKREYEFTDEIYNYKSPPSVLEREMVAEEVRQLIRDLVRSANFGRKTKQTLNLLNQLARGQPLYQAAKQVGICPKTARRRLNKIAATYKEEKYGRLNDYCA